MDGKQWGSIKNADSLVIACLTNVESALRCQKVNEIEGEDGVIEGAFCYLCSVKTFAALEIAWGLTGVDEGEGQQWLAENDMAEFIQEHKESINEELNAQIEEALSEFESGEAKEGWDKYKETMRNVGIPEKYIENRTFDETNCISSLEPVGCFTNYATTKYTENIQGFYCPDWTEDTPVILISGKINTNTKEVDLEAEYISIDEMYNVIFEVNEKYPLQLGSKKVVEKYQLMVIRELLEAMDHSALKAGTVYIKSGDYDINTGKRILEVTGDTGSEEAIRSCLESSEEEIKTRIENSDTIKVILENNNGRVIVSSIEYVPKSEGD